MIKELRVGNYVAYKGKPSLVCALDYDPKLRKETISVVYKWGEPPYKTNGDIQPILLTEKLFFEDDLFVGCISPFPQVCIPGCNFVAGNTFFGYLHYFPENDFVSFCFVRATEYTLRRMD